MEPHTRETHTETHRDTTDAKVIIQRTQSSLACHAKPLACSRKASPAATEEEVRRGSKSPKAQRKKKKRKKRWRAAEHFEKTHLVLSHGIKKARHRASLSVQLWTFPCFELLGQAFHRIGQRRRETAQRWGAHAYGGFCSFSCMCKTIICLETPHFCQPVISEPAERNRTKRNNRTGIIMRRQPPTSPNCLFFRHLCGCAV